MSREIHPIRLLRRRRFTTAARLTREIPIRRNSRRMSILWTSPVRRRARMTSRFDHLASHVDTEKGFISREIFVDADLYKEELDKVFTRAWLFIGHESLIPKPGDFYTTRMGEESVILCRDKKGVVHAFLNSCRHRGMKVCRYEQGNTSIFTCPYHSWTYTTDGKLQGVPQYRSLYDGQLDRDANSLVSVAK